MGFNGISWDFMGFHGIYPLVNVDITMENHHFLLGKLTIPTAIFNSYATKIARGHAVMSRDML